jgi:hypothetical protein
LNALSFYRTPSTDFVHDTQSAIGRVARMITLHSVAAAHTTDVIEIDAVGFPIATQTLRTVAVTNATNVDCGGAVDDSQTVLRQAAVSTEESCRTLTRRANTLTAVCTVWTALGHIAACCVSV